MNKPATLLLLVLMLGISSITSAAAPRSTPQATLDAYFRVLTTRNVTDISGLMTTGSMSRLKELMLEAFRFEKNRGGTALQNRFYGKTVSISEVEATPASFFLNQLAREILTAADMQHFFVDNRDIIGSVKEADDMMHFVVRLYLHQDERQNSEILVYTLIREDDGWKLEFPPTIKQALAVFEAGLRQSQSAAKSPR